MPHRCRRRDVLNLVVVKTYTGEVLFIQGGCPIFIHLEPGACAVLVQSFRTLSLALNGSHKERRLLHAVAMKHLWHLARLAGNHPLLERLLTVSANIQEALMGPRLPTAMRTLRAACAELAFIVTVEIFAVDVMAWLSRSSAVKPLLLRCARHARSLHTPTFCQVILYFIEFRRRKVWDNGLWTTLWRSIQTQNPRLQVLKAKPSAL